jgi:SNF2 family DNA or RNA helicase
MKLYKHQQEAVAKAACRPAFAYLCDMGTGKTLCDLYEDTLTDSYPHLVVTRNSIKQNWLLEINKWLSARSAVVLRGSTSQKIRQLRTAWESKVNYVIVNYDALYSLQKELIAYGFKKISFDEATAIKNPVAQRTKAAYNIAKHIPTRRILTGTPVTRYPLDIFAPFFILNPAILGFYGRPGSKAPVNSAFYPFKHRHAEIEIAYHPHKHEQIRKDDNGKPVFLHLDEIQHKIEPHSYICRKEDCLDLPPETFEERMLNMSDDMAEIYDGIVEEMIAELPDGEVISVRNCLTKLLRLQQILGGNCPTDSGAVVGVPENKSAEVLGILSETQGRTVIWCRFVDEIRRLTELLTKEGYNVLEYYGGLDIEKRNENYNLVSLGAFDVLIANAQAGGYGLDFTAANNSIYYSKSLSLEEFLQSKDRVYRNGQSKKVTHISLITKHTIEETLIEPNLKNKRDLAAMTMPKADFIKMLGGKA